MGEKLGYVFLVFLATIVLAVSTSNGSEQVPGQDQITASSFQSLEVILDSEVLVAKTLTRDHLVTNYFDNIKLILAYACGGSSSYGAPTNVAWSRLRDAQVAFDFTLAPGKTFEFDRDFRCLFSTGEGFKENGNGACNLASLTNWVASLVGLQTLAPTPHTPYGRYVDIPGVPKEFECSIQTDDAARQNLWITNNTSHLIWLKWKADSQSVNFSVVQSGE